MNSVFNLLPLLAPTLLLLYAILNLGRGKETLSFRAVSLIGIGVGVLSAVGVYWFGAIQSPLLGYSGLGFSIRLDALSAGMLTMISILGFVILSFSHNYLDGDPRKSVFYSRIAATIASVELLVLSGNLFQILIFWIITSVCLHYLLTFYRNRPQAIAAARKKFMVARLGDVSLLGALILIYMSLGTGDLTEIFQKIDGTASLDSWLTASTILLVVAALLKSAQFPSHGWLIEVVETPTPVSALLHAGLLNAGPFLMVRMSHLMIESPYASLFLIVVGSFTALYASVVYLTQPSIKVALGYSSVGHMGFSLLLCGLGVFPAAILHVVAHSFYKAHSFLSSGSAVDQLRLKKVALPSRKGHILRALISFGWAAGIYLLFCQLWGVDFTEDFNLVMVGGIIVLGISQLTSYAIDTENQPLTWLFSVILTLAVAWSFFTLESGARLLLSYEVPAELPADGMIRSGAVIVLAMYSVVMVIQLLAPWFRHSSIAFRLGIHIRNGFYVNILFDRMIGSLKNEKFKWANLEMKEEEKDPIQSFQPQDAEVLEINQK